MKTKQLLALFVALFSISACTQTEQSQTETTLTETNTTTVEKDVLRHVVLFKFKDTSSPEDVKKVEDAFLALPAKIKEIKSLEWGLNNSPEGHDQGYTHCFFVTFNSEEDRAVYLPHPDHQVFGAILGPHLDKVLVFDYWTK